jgi:hypothetical protein
MLPILYYSAATCINTRKTQVFVKTNVQNEIIQEVYSTIPLLVVQNDIIQEVYSIIPLLVVENDIILEVYSIIPLLIVSLHGKSVPSGPGPLIIEVLWSRSVIHTTLGKTLLDGGSVRRRDLYLTPHNTQKIYPCPPSGIRTRNPSQRAVGDPRLRPRGHLDRLRLLLST